MDAKVESLARYKIWVGGEWTDAPGGDVLETHNP